MHKLLYTGWSRTTFFALSFLLSFRILTGCDLGNDWNSTKASSSQLSQLREGLMKDGLISSENSSNKFSSEKELEEAIYSGTWSLQQLYHAYYHNDKGAPFSEFCEIWDFTDLQKLTFGSWIWVEESSPQGTYDPNDYGGIEKRSFDATQCVRRINDSAETMSAYSLDDSLILSIEEGGYQTTERIIKLTTDTLILAIDKFDNVKTYVNEQMYLNHLEYSKNYTNPKTEDIQHYKNIIVALVNDSIYDNVRSVHELTTKEGISYSSDVGGVHYLNGVPYSGYAYYGPVNDDPMFSDDCLGILIYQVVDGHRSGFWMIFEARFRSSLYKGNCRIKMSKYYENDFLVGRGNQYKEEEGKSYVEGSKFYIYGVKISEYGEIDLLP